MLSIRSKMEKILEERLSNYLPLIDQFFEALEKFDRIAIFRHEKPDLDALGSQMGLYHFIKDNWPNKEVIYVGDDIVGLSDRCFPKMMNVEDSWFEKKFLAIILDLSNLDRSGDIRYTKAQAIVKIDHHPLVEHFGDIEIVDPSMAAVGEFLASILLSQTKYKISPTAASNLFKAIVGDSGRFLYAETSAHTFYVSQKLIETGFNLNECYHEMYDEKQNSLSVKAYVLKHYKITKHGVAYYVLTDKVLKKYGLLPVQGKDNVNVFAHFDGIHAWCSVTEDKKKGNWRVSVRSAGKPIDDLCYKYGGGGHAQASATKLPSRKAVKELIDELDSLFK